VICEGGKRRESTSCFKELLSSRKIQDVEDIQGYLTQKTYWRLEASVWAMLCCNYDGCVWGFISSQPILLSI